MSTNFLSYLIIASFLSLASCTDNSEAPASIEIAANEIDKNVFELSTKQFNSSGMELGMLKTIDFHEIVKANGFFDVPPENKASISTYFGGTIKELTLLPGEAVTKGQILFTLENPDYIKLQQDYLEAKGQLAYLKSDFERQKSLAKDNVTSQKNYLKAESDYTVIQVKVKSLEQTLSLMNIDPKSLTVDNISTTAKVLSPINGFVTEVNIGRGSFLTPSKTALTIIDTHHLHLELNIFEKDLAKVSEGQPIVFSVQGNTNEEYKATVNLVNKTVDADKRTINIHAHLVDEELSNRFNPGMYIEASIYTTTTAKASLPQDALVEIDDKYFALILTSSSDEGYTFIKKELKVGAVDNGNIEILNSQEFDDKTEFLTKGAFNLILE